MEDQHVCADGGCLNWQLAAIWYQRACCATCPPPLPPSPLIPAAALRVSPILLIYSARSTVKKASSAPQLEKRECKRQLMEPATTCVSPINAATAVEISSPCARVTLISCRPGASSETPVGLAGAGDLFASGFLYGILRQYSLQKCCQMGCLAGGAIVQTLGAEMTASNWKWLFDRWVSRLLQAPARMHVSHC